MSNFSDGGRNMNNRYLAALGAALLLAKRKKHEEKGE